MNQAVHPTTPDRPRRRIARGVLALAALILAIILSNPSLRAYAGQLLGISRVSQIDGVVRRPISDPSVRSAPELSLDEMRTQAPFQLLLPSYVPPGISYAYGNYSERWQWAQLRFHHGTDQYTYFYLNLQPLDAQRQAPGYTVGSDAVVEQVDINGSAGGYVQGDWEFKQDAAGQPVQAADGSMTQIWDPTKPHQRIIWEAHGLRIALHASSHINKDELLRIARSLQLDEAR